MLILDVQNDFADPGGSLYVKGGQDVVPILNGEIEAAMDAGSPVFYTADWHPEATPHFAKDGGIWPVHCVGDTWGARFHPDLMVAGPVVRKGSHGEDGYSGFTMADPITRETTPTELEGMLRDRGIKRLVVAGLATDYCVRATALDGLDRGFSVDLLLEAVRSVDLQPGDGARALEEVKKAGGFLL